MADADTVFKTALVKRVKQWQSAGQEQKDLWQGYCAMHGNASDDPGENDPTFLL